MSAADRLIAHQLDQIEQLRAEVGRLRAMLAWIGDHDPQIVETAREKFPLVGKG